MIQKKAMEPLFTLHCQLIKHMPKKVLLIEDNKDSQTIYSDRLEKEGYNVVVAINGDEGLQKAQKENPDLILLDLLMPFVDGKQFLRNLREDRKLGSIPVIVLSNISDPEISVNYERKHTTLDGKITNKLEVDDYLIKTNTTLEQIVTSVKKGLGDIGND